MKHFFSAVILMGGNGTRMASVVPKQFHPLGQGLVYEETVRIFQECGLFQEIVLVVHPDWMEQVKIVGTKIVRGGPTRQASSFAGLCACDEACDFVMIHDAVRPFVSVDILRRNLELVVAHGAVDTCVSSADTVVEVEGSAIYDIPPRSRYFLGQTPQTFSYPLICRAHREAKRTNASDDCQLVMDLGHPVVVAEGSQENFKITTDWDLKMAQQTALEAHDRVRRSE